MSGNLIQPRSDSHLGASAPPPTETFPLIRNKINLLFLSIQCPSVRLQLRWVSPSAPTAASSATAAVCGRAGGCKQGGNGGSIHCIPRSFRGS